MDSHKVQNRYRVMGRALLAATTLFGLSLITPAAQAQAQAQDPAPAAKTKPAAKAKPAKAGAKDATKADDVDDKDVPSSPPPAGASAMTDLKKSNDQLDKLLKL